MEKALYQFHFDVVSFLPCFIPILVGLGFFFAWKWYPKQNPGVQERGKNGHRTYVVVKFIGWIVGTFAFLLGVLIIVSYIWNFQSTKQLLKENDVKIVEGYVTNYHPMPWSGHDTERFTINGVYFEYANAVIENCYHNAATHGGVITHNGQHLKIKYIQNSMGNKILYITEILS